MRRSVLLSLALVGWSLVANLLLGDRFYVGRNLALGGGLLVLARYLDASREELGLQARRAGAGARWGVAVAGVVALVLVVALRLGDALGPLTGLFGDARADLGDRALLEASLVRIPLGTALFEEIAFRGVLLALWLRAVSTGWAVAASSVVFGAWHVAPTMVALQINEVSLASVGGIGAVAGGVLVTAIAGAGFAGLRLGSGSLLAPVLAHWATNALGLLAASRHGQLLTG